MPTPNPGYGLLGRIGSEPLLLAPQFTGLGATIRRMLADAETRDEEDYLTHFASSWGDNRVDRKPYAFANGMAIIPVHGTLVNRFSASWGFITGYDYIRGAFDAALADPQVQGIAFDVDSYGGEVHGCFELSDHIHANRGKKPTVAIVNANCYSAAYATASAADKIIVTPSGGAGSIGVVTMHVDYSKAMADFGITVSFIFAGKHKVDGNPYQPLPDGVRADIQARIDVIYDKFVATVARNRGMDAKKVRDTEARCYGADEAKKIGLIDKVAAPKTAFTSFSNELSGSPSQEFDEMADNAPAPTADTPAAAPAAAASNSAADAPKSTAPAANTAAETPAPEVAKGTDASAERERIKAILALPEAADRASLANHLALNTEQTVEQAKGILAASPKEAKPAATASPFNAAMASGNPEMDAGGGTEDAPTALTGAARIVANYRAATGQKAN